MIRQYELVERVRAYDSSADEEALNRAYVFAMKAHGSQKRASGDPYFMHPLEVAGILTDYRLDTDTIITALLHDTIEDTEVTSEDIEEAFGERVQRLVGGVTKLTQIELQSSHTKQAENLRKLVIAMSDDIRVLLVKLADRLHNMRTLHFIKKPEKRRRIAAETMEIYAPLSERIGMHEIKDELQDMSFEQLNPEARDSIITRLEFLREQGGDLVGRILKELRDTVKENGIKAEISGREKAPYSIWRKMQRQDVGFEQLCDIMAFRVIVDDIQDCYRILGIIHGKYPTVPGRFKDYLSTPKPNGYQSLHTGVFGPDHHRIEIQIRTREMHEIAEYGVAAHWHYKAKGGSNNQMTEGRQYRWLRELLDILDSADDPEEFLEHTKLNMFQDQVFCFSPKGDLINLPSGATPVDFAYAVHTEIGNRCVGAKINRRIVPLRTELQNGDQVEVITSKVPQPSPTWERFVVTGKARACIRRYIRLQQRDEYLALGKIMLQRAFRQEEYEFAEKALQGVLKKFNSNDAEDLIAEVGSGHLPAREIVEAVFPGIKSKRTTTSTKIPVSKHKDSPHPESVPIRGLIPGMAMHFAGCCHPLPGDRIVGIVTTGRGVTIHTIDCDSLMQFQNEPERWLDVSWDMTQQEQNTKHVGRIKLTVINEQGALGSLSMVIAKNSGNIHNLKITHRTQEFYEMIIDVEVEDVRHLTNIIAALRATPEINSVERSRS
ncbi:bifunctional (p)ppGpp synthetase II and guanosine-3',5'-bis pyrophosphate 3'-pyrophosphohydrolase [Candidatus Terasakiella magnetica]|uniref:GTP pyrophosphokinase rsh n=1 Tax=Candidatus Terasakiella magnetica TaxID=1867952 RepID=A0A1C3RCU0_9PROT|nr:bifunctional (p)ppGpp synthetase/guanosine-3',5'-bis(diphosphate) 3'-pyrophosphohydrolase [Candidatus Terasakiella magnetica]SCA55090.1 bifunctional (p)ppGpp synthetase II and guanosine-3',5'-bis pyrophosphate 3'-pyrophosphohydrolase [Candidatus Terasakiella magnetica]